MAENGRLVVPLDMRRAMGLDKGGRVILRVEDGRLIMETVDTAVARVQALARQFGTPGSSLADELIADRRREAANE
ncbi:MULTISPECIES: AbrB/MazE/SpoVT family DNA-binding domain-containing protein [unclassified Azospirillum]|uniref:AbrB/MazE/SpoVT family DNA-binding domain-containing protein n=1 Tax=unclassified Azospirillum TaxID=2630922 RepID=UPI000B79851E|nr:MULTISPECIES: AbrB/MazE/SpoVT family DNA-binding domain-containing protein [unclassified Azospirillum]